MGRELRAVFAAILSRHIVQKRGLVPPLRGAAIARAALQHEPDRAVDLCHIFMTVACDAWQRHARER